MKKVLLFLVLVSIGLFSCSPKLSYFYKETKTPQYYVDSLTENKASDFRLWKNAVVVGVNDMDSTKIVTYVYRYVEGKQTFDITVTEFVNIPNKDFIVKQQERRE